MAQASRFSIFWFLTWAVAVVFVASTLAGAQSNPNAEIEGVQESLALEIENLKVIHQINNGQLDADRVGLHGDTESTAGALRPLESHRTVQRSILSQR